MKIFLLPFNLLLSLCYPQKISPIGLKHFQKLFFVNLVSKLFLRIFNLKNGNIQTRFLHAIFFLFVLTNFIHRMLNLQFFHCKNVHKKTVNVNFVLNSFFEHISINNNSFLSILFNRKHKIINVQLIAHISVEIKYFLI